MSSMQPDWWSSAGSIRYTGHVLIAVPCLAYFLLINHYALNIPFFDDFAVILDDTIKARYAQDWPQLRAVLFRQSSGHIPAVTRLLALLQTHFGHINFRNTVLFGNAGLLASVILLCTYCAKKLAVPVVLLSPVAFLLTTPAHWESMDFATPALQMYWGSLLLPAICFIAAIEGFPIISALMLVIAMYWSSGSLALIPMIGIYLLLQKRWFDALVFHIILAFALAIFLHFNRTYNDYRHVVPQVSGIISYTAAFFGNIFSSGQYDMSPFINVYRAVGIIVILAGTAALFTRRKLQLPFLLFIYVLMLGILAAYARGVAWVPPRYAVFALLALAMIYVMYLEILLHAGSRHVTGYVTAMLIFTIGLWTHGMYMGNQLLATNYHVRIETATRYLSGDRAALEPLSWNAEYAHAQLELAKEMQVYDMESIRQNINNHP